MARNCTRYLSLNFEGTAEEIEVECQYDFQPEEGDSFHEQHFPARVTLERVWSGKFDLMPALPRSLVAKLEAEILQDELTGAFV